MIRYVLGLVLSVFALGTWAQTSPPQHQHPDVTVVDGAKSPELIPDSTAYRAWFLIASLPPNPTPKHEAAQQAHINKVNLSGVDQIQLLPILADFRKQYMSLIGRHNDQERAALKGGPPVDETAFLNERDDLVSATRNVIGLRLSSTGVTLLDAHIQREKQFMQIHTAGGGQ